MLASAKQWEKQVVERGSHFVCVAKRGNNLCCLKQSPIYWLLQSSRGNGLCCRERVCRLMVGLVRIAHLYPVDLKMSLVDSGVAL